MKLKKGLIRKDVPDDDPDSLRNSIKGGVIDNIWPDYERGFVCVLLADKRVLCITGTGVMAFKHMEAYTEHCDEVMRDIRGEIEGTDTIQ